ncbi:MAG TPA: hypothetical protein VKS21_00635, partial [Spirochaetota bacterium]|nr:hypothetical protein [Spirochaetota bacterium]
AVRKVIRHNRKNYSRNIVDQDGEGREPWYPEADVMEIQANGKASYDPGGVVGDAMQICLVLNNSLAGVRPARQSAFHPVYFKTADTNISLYINDLVFRRMQFFITDGMLSCTIKKKIGERSLHLKLDTGAGYKGLVISGESDKNIFFPWIDFSLDTVLYQNNHIDFSVKLGEYALPLTGDTALFLSADYMSGTAYYWDDADNDLVLDNGEKTGAVYKTSGGKWHDLSRRLTTPYCFYLNIPARFRINNLITISSRLSWKSFRRLLQVVVDENDYTARDSSDADAGMITGTNGMDTVYTYNGGETHYKVKNTPLYPYNDNFFTGNPFYAGAAFTISAHTSRFFTSATFHAYMCVGTAGLGNGFLLNNYGNLSELRADPNAGYKALARMVNDRGYLIKLAAGFRPVKNFLIALGLRYKDGEPFSFYNAYIYDESSGRRQAAIVRRNVMGDNIYNGDFGTREDALWNFDLKLSYTLISSGPEFRFTIKAHNLIDIGSELAEKVFSGRRTSLETVNPAGMQLSVSCFF